MTSLAVKLIVAALGLTVFFASAADAAKQRKHHKQVAVPAAALNGHYRGLNLFMRGPFVVGGMQLTDDPDPFIRSQILRADGNFGGHR